ncbi:hypothetical protein [Polaribacter sp. Hel1_85]|uniref:hypothetical protein n=1 Tax=Polaribacter sp. Hel1_85 TaxID=1250005 RepID=UPI00052D3A4F|nr:hypothetical protein [Polaribacter sp. Hel1_85]KGL61894.1 hypothetical protein PHEL85_1680 [Polaribacter sp. Hel1_85]
MLQKEFHFIQEHLVYIDKEDIDVSKANVGWHLDHSLKVVNSVCTAIKNSNAIDYKREFNLLRLITFTLGFFPRGKAKAPKRVLPPEVVLKEEIKSQLELAFSNLEMMKVLDENQYFTHPLFKQLNKKQTLKFLKLHTNHHLKIVKDILK